MPGKGKTMPRENVLAINHRDLILSSRRKARFYFLRLPHDLQDRIIDGMDLGEMTLSMAQTLALEAGLRLSFQAIASYYRAVRQRRAQLLREAVAL